MSSCSVLEVSANACDVAADVLEQGGLVAIPGLTNYAVIVDATRFDATERVYALKDRERSKPLTLLSPPHDAELYIQVPAAARKVLCLMGGPIALVGDAQPELMFIGNINARDRTAGVFWLELPVHKFLYAAARCPVAGTSLNRAGQWPIRQIQKAVDEFGDRVDLILDGGDAPVQVGQSTVVDISTEPVTVLREGLVSVETVSRFVDPVMSKRDAANG